MHGGALTFKGSEADGLSGPGVDCGEHCLRFACKLLKARGPVAARLATRNPGRAWSIMRFGILGPVEVIDDHGRVVALGGPAPAPASVARPMELEPWLAQ
jgi:hypothetical protein